MASDEAAVNAPAVGKSDKDGCGATDLNMRLEHLKMIQNVIDRLAGNSFSIKGWSVLLTAGLVAFLAKPGDPEVASDLAGAVVFPILCLGLLDGYYLMLERRYRDLHKRVRIQPRLTLDSKPVPLFSMAPVTDSPTECWLEQIWKAFDEYTTAASRPAVFVFHSGLIICAVLAILLG